MSKANKTRFDKYNERCKQYSMRFVMGKDDKYIEFMKNCPNRMEFIRNAIDNVIAGS